MRQTILRPYLVEEVVSGDKFNIFAFMGLLTVIALFGLYLYSSRDLFGKAIKSIGVFGGNNPIAAEYQQPTSTPVIEGFFMQPASGTHGQGVDQQQVQPTYTPYPTYTPFPTPTKTKEVLQIVNTPTPDLSEIYKYNLNVDLYYRSELLKVAYQDLPVDFVIPGKYSWYWPPLGGINCDQVNGIDECLQMASGYHGADYVGIAWACPPEFPFGSVLHVRELGVWGKCLDRGSAIIKDIDGLYWFDQLLDFGLTFWSDKITIDLYLPK